MGQSNLIDDTKLEECKKELKFFAKKVSDIFIGAGFQKIITRIKNSSPEDVRDEALKTSDPYVQLILAMTKLVLAVCVAPHTLADIAANSLDTIMTTALGVHDGVDATIAQIKQLGGSTESYLKGKCSSLKSRWKNWTKGLIATIIDDHTEAYLLYQNVFDKLKDKADKILNDAKLDKELLKFIQDFKKGWEKSEKNMVELKIDEEKTEKKKVVFGEWKHDMTVIEGNTKILHSKYVTDKLNSHTQILNMMCKRLETLLTGITSEKDAIIQGENPTLGEKIESTKKVFDDALGALKEKDVVSKSHSTDAEVDVVVLPTGTDEFDAAAGVGYIPADSKAIEKNRAEADRALGLSRRRRRLMERLARHESSPRWNE